jgi:hypothetical protein
LTGSGANPVRQSSLASNAKLRIRWCNDPMRNIGHRINGLMPITFWLSLKLQISSQQRQRRLLKTHWLPSSSSLRVLILSLIMRLMLMLRLWSDCELMLTRQIDWQMRLVF